jgi:hypothetical protein
MFPIGILIGANKEDLLGCLRYPKKKTSISRSIVDASIHLEILIIGESQRVEKRLKEVLSSIKKLS